MCTVFQDIGCFSLPHKKEIKLALVVGILYMTITIPFTSIELLNIPGSIGTQYFNSQLSSICKACVFSVI